MFFYLQIRDEKIKRIHNAVPVSTSLACKFIFLLPTLQDNNYKYKYKYIYIYLQIYFLALVIIIIIIIMYINIIIIIIIICYVYKYILELKDIIWEKMDKFWIEFNLNIEIEFA